MMKSSIPPNQDIDMQENIVQTQTMNTLRASGYCTRKEFARLIGRADGSHITKLAERHKVPIIAMQTGKRRHIVLFRESDAGKIPDADPVKQTNASGRLAQRIIDLEAEVKTLRSEMNDVKEFLHRLKVDLY